MQTGLPPNMLLWIFCCNVPCLCTLCAQRINITDKCAACAFVLFLCMCVCVHLCVLKWNKKINGNGNGNVFHHECYLNAFLSIENLQFRCSTHTQTYTNAHNSLTPMRPKPQKPKSCALQGALICMAITLFNSLKIPETLNSAWTCTQILLGLCQWKLNIFFIFVSESSSRI